MSLTSGTRLGVYEVIASIGGGGMGEVYAATDTTLGRQVAIKILPDAFATDPERMARFEREAKTLASLNHPNIAAIYAVEKSAGLHALVMELVEGDDLSQRIARGAMPIDEALPIAKQIAEALEAAHEQGIIHRDLKPANIKVRADGTVKVLDFGLAKAMEPAAGSSPSLSMSPTLSMHATQAGIILGTAAYMAPEQARGKAVDKRADIWAFGAVLFEMLTGKRAFPGEDLTDTLAAVVKLDPPWDAVGADVPARVRQVLRVCLQKDPKQRAQAIGDVRLALEGAFETAVSQTFTAVSSPSRSSRWLAPIGWTVLGFAVAVALWIGVSPGRSPAANPQAIVSSVVLPSSLISSPGVSFAVSPDGQRLAFVARGPSGANVLWIRPLSSLDAQPLTGTDGASGPFWSPDSKQIGFSAGGKLKRLDVSGGAAVTLSDGGTFATPGSWSRDDVLLFTKEQKIFRVSAKGGAAVATRAAFYFPFFLPDSRHFLYSSGRVVYLGSLNDADPTTILEGVGNAMYASGHIVYLRETTLFAQKFDTERVKLDGDPFPLAERIWINTGSGAGAFSVSQSGVLVYKVTETAPSRLTWLDRGGRVTGVLGEAGRYSEASLSADGSRVAVSMFGESTENRNIWLVDVRRGLRTRVTTERTDDTDPLLSPDGTRVVYSSRRGAVKGLYVKDLNGTTGPELLVEDLYNKAPQAWSADGKLVMYSTMNLTTSWDLWAVPVAPDRKPVVVLQTNAGESRGELSPDGRFLAYASTESGRSEAYVARFPIGGTKWPVSSTGGTNPHWRRDGKELFFMNGSALMHATVTATAAGVDIGAAEALFDLGSRLPPPVLPISNVFDVSPDGQRFLFILPQDAAPEALTLVVNWPALLRP